MSARAEQKVFRHSNQTGSDRLCLVILAQQANDDGVGVCISVPELAYKLGMTDRSVRKVLGRLEESGEVIRYHSAGYQGYNLYDIVFQDGSNETAIERQKAHYAGGAVPQDRGVSHGTGGVNHGTGGVSHGTGGQGVCPMGQGGCPMGQVYVLQYLLLLQMTTNRQTITPGHNGRSTWRSWRSGRR